MTSVDTHNNSARAARREARTPLWAKVLLVLFVASLIAAGAYAGFTAGKSAGATETRDTQVIRSVTAEEEVVLMTSGVAGVLEERGDGLDVFGLFELPGSERALFVRYEFDAKLGVEGKDVKVREVDQNSYLISIPKFVSLGYDQPELSRATEENGILSWTTPEIDQLEIAEAVLSGRDGTEYDSTSHIDGLRPLLEEQARAFYTRIVTSIDPDAIVEFEFAR
ncbi:MAG: hypothetical protein K0S70_237 [Microbacterium sp.]|jgi:hypothetical protein|nr:hypothetical protein [Microbacterium sp.]